MSRFVSATNEAASERPSVRIFVACDLDFASGHVRAHDGIGPLTWGGNAYDGVGRFGGIEVADESIETIAKPFRLTLSGVDSATIPAPLVATAIDEQYQGRDAIVSLGLCDNNTNQLIDDPETWIEGKMDRMEVHLDSGAGDVSLSCENRLRTTPRISRYTNEDQQLAYSGDRFFDLTPKIAGYPGKWGQNNFWYRIRDRLGLDDAVGRLAGRLGG